MNLVAFARAWKLTHFQPISFCNTFSLHLMDEGQRQLVIDINGTVWAEWSGVSEGISLKECLEGPEKEMADFDLELVASDSLLLAGKGTSEKYAFDGCIGTCWVVYDHLFAVERQFAALFLIEPNFCIKMVARFALQSMPTFSKIEQTTDHQIRWLVCTYSHGISAFSVEHDGSVTYKPKVDPMLALSDISGTVIRYEHISTWGPHRLLLVGYDTGFVTASICPTRRDASDEHSPLIDRKSLKFDGPVSVLKVLRVGEKSLSVLVSSTLGPATVWTLRKNDNDQLSWNLSTVLQESELYDTVVTGTVYNSDNCGKVDNAIGGVDDGGGGMVLIGTYGELLLAYDLHELLSQQDEVGPLLSINIASPILAVEQFGEELLVLSNRGLHRLSPSADEALALTQKQRKSPATVTTTTTPPAKTADENT